MSNQEKDPVDAVVDTFYNDHHDFERFKNELKSLVRVSKAQGFTEAKHQMVKGLDFRIDALRKAVNTISTSHLREDFLERLNELSGFRAFVKGLLWKNEESSGQSQSEDRDPKRV